MLSRRGTPWRLAATFGLALLLAIGFSCLADADDDDDAVTWEEATSLPAAPRPETGSRLSQGRSVLTSVRLRPRKGYRKRSRNRVHENGPPVETPSRPRRGISDGPQIGLPGVADSFGRDETLVRLALAGEPLPAAFTRPSACLIRAPPALA